MFQSIKTILTCFTRGWRRVWLRPWPVVQEWLQFSYTLSWGYYHSLICSIIWQHLLVLALCLRPTTISSITSRPFSNLSSWFSNILLLLVLHVSRHFLCRPLHLPLLLLALLNFVFEFENFILILLFTAAQLAKNFFFYLPKIFIFFNCPVVDQFEA